MKKRRTRIHRRVAVIKMDQTPSQTHPDPVPFFDALLTMLDSKEGGYAFHENLCIETFKTWIKNPANWQFIDHPEMVGVAKGASDQRKLTPAQFITILNSGGVSDPSEFKILENNVQTRFSGGHSFHTAPSWHIDNDPWNPPQYNILTVAFSDDPYGGTHYLDIPQFQLPKRDIDPVTRLQLLESAQSVLEEFTLRYEDTELLKQYTRYTTPYTIYRNLTQTHFHKSPPKSQVRVLFIVGIPKNANVRAR
jgi:hypothetical protein